MKQQKNKLYTNSNNFRIWLHSDKLFYRQTFHTSLNNSTYLVLKLSLVLKVMPLSQPEKLWKITKIIITNKLICNSIEQCLVIPIQDFVIKNTEVML